MANPHFSVVLASFEARVHNTKDRLIAIPAKVQTQLGLAPATQHLVCYSIRPAGAGRWNHGYAKLTCDNEFAAPRDVPAGADVDVKLHRFIPDADAFAPSRPSVGTPATAGAALLAMAAAAGSDPREDGSERIDEELYGR